MDSTDFVASSICNELQTCFEPKGFNVIRTRCKIHPSVILSMLDAHGRLKENEDFAIGTFLGYVTVDSTGVLVDVVDCFINPYQWDSHSSSLNIQKESHDWMLKLKEKLNPRLTVVGWCCTTNIILYATALSDWVQSEQKANRIYVPKILNEPIHVLINPRFDKSLSILTQIKVLVRDSLRQSFHPVPFEIHVDDQHVVASVIKNSQAICLSSEFDKSDNSCLQDSSPSLINLLKSIESHSQTCLKYIESVLDGTIEPDVALGRQLMQAVCLEALMPKNELKTCYENTIQDGLMITYLKNLACLQFSIAEKLNASFHS